MNTQINVNKPEKEEKHSGGSHIFLFLGGAIVILILIKLLADKFLS